MNDAVLVRAPVGAVYRSLTDLDGWPSWLAGARSVRLSAEDRDGDRHVLVLPDGRARWRLAVHAHGWRHDAGVRWVVRGAVALEAEWWLEGRPEGAVVHHVVHGTPVGRSAVRRVARHRKVIVHAMQALKDHLELAVDLATGRTP